MADPKKSAHSSDGAGFYGFFWILVALVFLGIVIFGLASPFDPTYLNLDYLFAHMLSVLRSIVTFFVTYQVGGLIKFFVGLICILLIGFIFWLFLRLLEIEEEHEHHVYPHGGDDSHNYEKPKSLFNEVVSDVGGLATGAGSLVHAGTIGTFEKLVDSALGEKEGANKWRMIVKHMASKNPSDWKLAVIEADTILDVLVERSGFPGVTLGERLKNSDPGVFRTLSYAREAHGIRNRIAHEGSNFVLSEREAKHIIKLYEDVFHEFDYI